MEILGCDSSQPIWTGLDINLCFLDRFLNLVLPSSLAIISGLFLLTSITNQYLKEKTGSPAIQLPLTDGHSVTPSPVALENEVLKSSALDVYGVEPELGKSVLERIKDWVLLLFLSSLLGLEIFNGLMAVLDHTVWAICGWGMVALAGYLTLLSAIALFAESSTGRKYGLTPYGASAEIHRTTLLFAYLLLKLVNFRHALIDQYTGSRWIVLQAITSSLVLVLVLLDIFTPYRSNLDGVLEGHRSRGRSSLSSSSANISSKIETKAEMIEEPSSLFARTFFSYVNKPIFRHFYTPIKMSNVPQLREDDRTAVVVSGWRDFRQRQRSEHTDSEKEFGKGGLTWNLVVYFKSYLLLQMLWAVVYVLASFIAPWTLKLILEFVAYRKLSSLDPDTYPPRPMHLAVLYVVAMFFGQVVSVTSQGYALWIGRRICVRLRSIIITEVFTKALRRSDSAKIAKIFDEKLDETTTEPGSVNTNDVTDISGDENKDGKETEGQQEEASEGKIINLISVDAFSISEIAAYLLFLFPEGPLSIILSIVFLYRLLGYSSLFGVAALAAVTPLQIFLARLYVKVQDKLLLATDARLDLATEVLSSIRLVKFNGWEDRFFARMKDTRQAELKLIRQRFIVWMLQGVGAILAPSAVTLVTFAVHTKVFKAPLPTETAFTALALFNMLRSPLEGMTDMVAHVLAAHVSCKRVVRQSLSLSVVLIYLKKNMLTRGTSVSRNVDQEDFLTQPDTDKYSNLSVPSSTSTTSGNEDEPKIGFKNATLTYATKEEFNKNPSNFGLKDLSIKFPTGELSLIAGSVGSGKTTVLLSLLGETTLIEGKVFMPDHFSRHTAPIDPLTGFSETVAYCPQQPWLIGDSIRENILFGSPWDEARYLETIAACQLERDLDIFELGDETEVGEKGTTCSGGQKARIALARACYSRSSIVILDDVLSAVDAHTARFLYQNCLKGPLLRGRTVILVTHAVGLCLTGAAYGIVLDQGCVIAQGTAAHLKSLNAFPEDALADDAHDNAHHPIASSSKMPIGESGIGKTEATIEQDLTDDETVKVDLEATKKILDETRLKKKLVKEETSSEGGVSKEVYKLYMAAMGAAIFWIMLILAYLGSQGVQIWTNLWLRKWAAQYNSSEVDFSSLSLVAFFVGPVNAVPHRSLSSQTTFSAAPTQPIDRFAITGARAPAEDTTNYYLAVYAAITVLYLVAIAIRMALLFAGSLRASKTLYENLLKRVLHARVRFFDSTPSGRIINRLSKDVESLDQEAAPVFLYLLVSIMSSFAVLLVVTVSTPPFLFGAAFIVGLYWIIGAVYLALSRELKRIESISKSPILVCFSEALNGMTSIRSYGDTARFTKQALDLIDNNNAPFLLLWQANRWLSVCCDCTGALVALFAAVLILLNPSLDAGVASLSLSYSITFTEQVLWVVRLYSALEINLNSVERIREYLTLESEEEEDAKGIEPPAYWPSKEGKIEVKSLEIKYSPELNPVLKDVSFEVLPHERVGICGRTGSGKSTLALTFFRFMEASGGAIFIDGMDISKISLAALRRSLTIIPQEALLFSGSLRSNLDPFSLYEDAELWEALVAVQMASWSTPAASRIASRAPSRVPSTTSLANMGNNEEGSASAIAVEEEGISQITSLETPVAAGGKNFSAGQRQLLALARGLLKLKQSNILLIDEGTANLDHATDNLIQQTMRESFVGVTMLIIAHRLRTVIDCDKILVLDAGNVEEFGSPVELLAKEGGSFRQLCEKSGELATLQEMADAAHQARSEHPPPYDQNSRI
ncbi:Multidrug resistance-associated protein/mitoxantrone resistance protein, ABC superfamily [Phaffia rhodozyma]|uniref:Multidrug resistance-associated protein/mitoxantrone resistance protein, ABC superfamily n=1 Tax=Phaffia rhodozyma TaxID=264483 RepID=A0A0F7SW77_PHARH|nr:Multidrug resistance-associated protein/mitoxantrone resistance protein, ABC superfamily [Phaffia rhodozyma]